MAAAAATAASDMPPGFHQRFLEFAEGNSGTGNGGDFLRLMSDQNSINADNNMSNNDTNNNTINHQRLSHMYQSNLSNSSNSPITGNRLPFGMTNNTSMVFNGINSNNTNPFRGASPGGGQGGQGGQGAYSSPGYPTWNNRGGGGFGVGHHRPSNHKGNNSIGSSGGSNNSGNRMFNSNSGVSNTRSY
eukprot:CAMPEP_0175061930 /NCGR_PEP_ID=MMETSP0052_2-20121109/13866_1 /TAXON_ID=51329 ORGANISM="Polytomella parva, Strain SAG 63-3" /NCGR_SAMPLE_ID=MMETSP0052_2 /ASSEMBLY_ACC=CAM_ASM_000194 /LENGTH=187 /DNA_ID=CAMNT_0016327855 /DNA_START=91 /DNA_END=654 /DNA_ORIENTATION=-